MTRRLSSVHEVGVLWLQKPGWKATLAANKLNGPGGEGHGPRFNMTVLLISYQSSVRCSKICQDRWWLGAWEKWQQAAREWNGCRCNYDASELRVSTDINCHVCTAEQATCINLVMFPHRDLSHNGTALAHRALVDGRTIDSLCMQMGEHAWMSLFSVKDESAERPCLASTSSHPFHLHVCIAELHLG